MGHEESAQVSRARAWLDYTAPLIPCIFTSSFPRITPNITSISTGDNSVKWGPWLMLSYDNRIIGTNRHPFRSNIFNVCCILKTLTFFKLEISLRFESALSRSSRSAGITAAARHVHNRVTQNRICKPRTDIDTSQFSARSYASLLSGLQWTPSKYGGPVTVWMLQQYAWNRILYLCVICACCLPISSWALCTNVCLHFTVLRKVPVMLVF